MMVLPFCHLADQIGKVQRLAEIAEFVFLFKVMLAARVASCY